MSTVAPVKRAIVQTLRASGPLANAIAGGINGVGLFHETPLDNVAESAVIINNQNSHSQISLLNRPKIRLNYTTPR